MYRLYIKSNEIEEIVKPWIELDLGDEAPAMTYQVNNLAELKDRNASYSQRIKLPKTSRNCSMLGFVNVFDVTARDAYNPPPALLTNDDIPLSPDGAILSIEAVTPTTIEVQIKSGTYDFFKFLETLPMDSSEDGGTAPGFIVDWNMADIPSDGIGTLPNGVPYRYLFATVDQNVGEIPSATVVSWIKSMRALYPHIPLVATVTEILRSQGYTLETDVNPDSLAVTDWIACMPPKMVGGYYYYNTRFWNFSGFSVGHGVTLNITYPQSDVVSDNTGRPAYLNNSNQTPVVWALQDCVYKVTEQYRCTNNIGTGGGSGSSATVRVRRTVAIVNPDGSVFDRPVNNKDVDPTPAGQTRSIEHYVELKEGQGISISGNTFFPTAGSPNNPVLYPEFIVTLEANAYAAEDDETVYNRDTQIGSMLDLLASTGFATVSDLFKVFMQLYGLTVEVNSDTQTVRAYTFNYLRSKKEAGDVVDWSAAVALTKDERHTFKIGDYAQTNSIKLKENSNDFNYTDVATFGINNKTLAEEKELFTIAFESGRNTKQYGIAQGMLIANYPLFEVAEDGNTRSYVGDCGPHIVRVNSSGTITVQLTQGTLGSKTVTLNPAVHIPLRDYIDVYYDTLTRVILINARAVSVPLYLSVLDIYGLDFFKPVWIEYYGGYFYILKVNNFIAGRLATCDLAKL